MSSKMLLPLIKSGAPICRFREDQAKSMPRSKEHILSGIVRMNQCCYFVRVTVCSTFPFLSIIRNSS